MAELNITGTRRQSEALKGVLTRIGDMRRRGLPDTEFALVITNDEALDLVGGMLAAAVFPVGMIEWAKGVVREGKGHRISGKLNVFGVMVCVKQ